MLDVVGRLLLMFSGDSAMSSVAPFQSHDLLLAMCDNATQGIILQNQLDEMNMYCIELAQLIAIAKNDNCTTLCVNFIRGLVSKIQEVHNKNQPPRPLAEIPGSYNPSSGNAYYFTECQNMKLVQETNRTMDYLMTGLKLMTHATSCSPKYQRVALDTCSYGSAQFMAIAMDSILFQDVKAEKILLHHCINIAMKGQTTFTMISLANFLSTF